MPKSFKFRRIGKDAAEVLASSPSQSAAARRLGVDRSTLHRWLVAGKVQRPPRREKRATEATPAAEMTDQTPEQWAATLRADYLFSSTEEVLVDLGAVTLRLSKDERLSPSERLAAVGRFQQLIKQLHLEAAEDGEETKTRGDVRPWPRHVG